MNEVCELHSSVPTYANTDPDCQCFYKEDAIDAPTTDKCTLHAKKGACKANGCKWSRKANACSGGVVAVAPATDAPVVTAAWRTIFNKIGNGGCRGADFASFESFRFTSSVTFEECKAVCVNDERCTGVEYVASANRCQLQDYPIKSSAGDDDTNVACYNLVRNVEAIARSSRFHNGRDHFLSQVLLGFESAAYM
jgi:hypothetical protein